MFKTVYLCGPIRCISEEEAYTWRDKAVAYLKNKGFNAIIPVAREDESAGEIVGNDLLNIHHSDIVLAHVPDDVVAIGTNMEIFFASREGKIVVLWGGTFDCSMSPWLQHHAEAYCDTLDEALCFIWKNYSD